MQKMLSDREKNILYITIGVVSLSIIFNLLLSPIFRRNAELNKQINLTRQKLKKYVWLLSQEEVIKNKYSSLLSSSRITTETDVFVAGLEELERAAKESGLRILDIRPENKTKIPGAYKEGLIDLRMEGTSEEFMKFMYDIENSLLLLKVKKMQLSSKANAQLLEARFTINQILISE